MALALRVRHPSGSLTLQLANDTTVEVLCASVERVTGIPANLQSYKLGFPPRKLSLGDLRCRLTDLGVRKGEALVVERASGSDAVSTSTTDKRDLSMDTDSCNRGNNCVTPGSLPDGRVVVRRVIASDNSCLFNAVGYSLERSRSAAPRLRRIVADTVRGDPVTFNDAFLEKSNAEYQKWILGSENWGGPIELFVLAKYYRCEIASFDIQTARCDIYGRGEGYHQRCILLFDGLHYDVLALAAFKDAPEEVDCTLLDTGAPDVTPVMEAAEGLVHVLQRQKNFTNLGTFTLQCAECYKGLVGQQEAREHAKLTGHQNFQEYSN